MKKFLRKHKVEMIIVLAVLLLVTPFIWPVMIAILWDVMGVVLPVVAAMVLLRFYGNANLSEEKPAAKKADYWYASYGKKRLLRLAEELKGEGIYEAWIHPDGICRIKTEKGYRRRAILAEYPADHAKLIADKLCADGIRACMHGRYLYLSFYKSRRAA